MTDLRPVLYAEDDENDVFLMQRAFAKNNVANPLAIVRDGKEAMAYLSRSAPFEHGQNPCLVLLDLSMPGKHGLEVLKWLKSQPQSSGVPVVVLSSSNQKSDVHRAYLLGANGFMIKPGDPGKLVEIVKVLQKFWLSNERPDGTFIDFAAGANVPPPTKPPEAA